MSGSWCTIESDPGVFTELLEKFGVRGLAVEELWGLDDSALAPLAPIHGLFFLFKWQKQARGEAVNTSEDAEPVESDAIFIRQTVSNACGTLALLHVLLNNGSLDERLGPTLATFKEFVAGIPPEYRGHALGQYEPLRVAHNSFARPEPFEIEERVAREDDDVFHFVAFTLKGDRVLEFDGLQNAPVELGEWQIGADTHAKALRTTCPREYRAGRVAPGQDWLSIATPAITSRIATYSESEIRFNLLALVGSKLETAREDTLRTISQLTAVHAALAAQGAAAALAAPSALPGVAEFLATCGHFVPATAPVGIADTNELVTQYRALRDEVGAHLATHEAEREKHERWHIENERRRHNFVPFIAELLKQLAAAGELAPMMEAGKKKAADARERMRQQRLAAKKAAAAVGSTATAEAALTQ